MREHLDDDEIFRRFRIVGGSIHYVVDTNETELDLDVDRVLDTLDLNTVQWLADGRFAFTFHKTAPASPLVGLGPKE